MEEKKVRCWDCEYFWQEEKKCPHCNDPDLESEQERECEEFEEY